MQRAICFLVWVLSIGPALAADPCPELEEHYSAAEVARCAQAGLDQSDHALSDTFSKVLSYLKREEWGSKPLIMAERAWIIERDARCAHRAKEKGDLIDQTGNGVIIDCKKDWTDARISTLKDYLSDRCER